MRLAGLIPAKQGLNLGLLIGYLFRDLADVVQFLYQVVREALSSLYKLNNQLIYKDLKY
jgi:hypothetical protein